MAGYSERARVLDSKPVLALHSRPNEAFRIPGAFPVEPRGETEGRALPGDEIQLIDTDSIPPHKRNLYLRATLVTVLGNVMLFVAKGVTAHVSRSTAIYADAANSASDVVYSLFMGLGLWLSLRPADATHPHGHRRIESVVGVFIGAMMALAGAEALRRGIHAWREEIPTLLSLWPALILIGAGLVKGVMYLVVQQIGQKAASPALCASAQDNLSDVVSSGMALLGVLGSRFFFAADPLAAFLVALFILRSAWRVAWESLRHLTGGSPPPGVTQAVIERARAVPGVLNVHRVILHYVGPEVSVDIHMEMDGHLTLYETHRVSDAVQETVEALGQIDHAYVHVEPVDS